MAGTKNTLTEKLEDADIPTRSIDMNTPLSEFAKELWGRYRKSKESGRTYSSGKSLAMCMLGYLEKTDYGLLRAPKTIKTVGELYSLTQEEVGYTRGYGKKTWHALNDFLKEYGLPPIRLPEKYTC